MTFIILKIIGLFTPLRMSEEEMDLGDLAVHDELAYPADLAYDRVTAGMGRHAVAEAARTDESASRSEPTPSGSEPV
jgi:Amt family ammonium transporter